MTSFRFKQSILALSLAVVLPILSLIGPVAAQAAGPGSDGGAVVQDQAGDMYQLGTATKQPAKKLMLSEVPQLPDLIRFFSTTSLLAAGPIQRFLKAVMPTGDRQYIRIFDSSPFIETIDQLKNQYSKIFNIPIDRVVISAFTQGQKTYLLPSFFDKKMTSHMQLAILLHESLWAYVNQVYVDPSNKPDLKKVVAVETAFYNFLKSDNLHSGRFNYEFYQQLSYFDNNPQILLQAALFSLYPDKRNSNIEIDTSSMFPIDKYNIVNPDDWRTRSQEQERVQIDIAKAQVFIAGQMQTNPNQMMYWQAVLEVLPNMEIWNQFFNRKDPRLLNIDTYFHYIPGQATITIPNVAGGDGESCMWVNQEMFHEKTHAKKTVSFCLYATTWMTGSWANEIDLSPIKEIIGSK